MSDLSQIKQRLLVAGTPFFGVRGASTLAQVTDKPDGTLPQAFVVLASDMAHENSRSTGTPLQRKERDVTVVVVLQHLGDRDGADTVDPLEEVLEWIDAQLLGWQTTEMVDVITYVRGEALEAADGIVWYAATYSAPKYIQGQA